MTDSLAQSLVDAAAEASWPGPPDWNSPVVQAINGPRHRDLARRAVAAALERLAVRGVDILAADAWLSEHDRLLKLAAEIREGT